MQTALRFRLPQTLGWSSLAPLVVQTRGARYGRQHQEPILDKESLAKPLSPDDPRRYLPIKAPTNDACPHVFSDPLVNKFVNIIMTQGKKELARRVLAGAFEIIKREQVKKFLSAPPEERKNIETDPRKIFAKALENSEPILTLIPVTRGGITYQVPSPLSKRYAKFMSMQWMRDVSREKQRSVHMDRSLAKEILDAFNNEGRVVKKKQELHKQCEANKAYAHYRWT